MDPQGQVLQRIAAGRTAEVFAWENGRVLKLFLDWCPPTWVDFELNTVRIVHQAGIPTPAAHGIVEIDGRRGIVYDRVDGVSMLALIGRSPLKMVDYARQLARLQLEIHRCPGDGLPEYLRRLVGPIESAQALPEALRRKALERLAQLPPGDRLCHADFHPDNILVSRDGPLVIDWATAACGHPAADVARTRILLSIGAPLEGGSPALMLILKVGRGLFYRAYLDTYRRAAPEVMRLSQDFLPVIAAARFEENISSESKQLLGLVRQAFEVKRLGS